MKRDNIYVLIATALWLITLFIPFEPVVNNRITGVLIGLLIPRNIRAIYELITIFKTTDKPEDHD